MGVNLILRLNILFPGVRHGSSVRELEYPTKGMSTGRLVLLERSLLQWLVPIGTQTHM